MSYRVQVSGKIFESDDLRTLLKRAVEARRYSDYRAAYSSEQALTDTPTPTKSVVSYGTLIKTKRSTFN